MPTTRARRLALILSLAGAAGTARADGIESVTVTPSPALVGSEVQVVVNARGEGATLCGYQIDFGDGERRELKADAKHGLFPHTEVKRYRNDGQYTLTVTGKRVTTHLPCSGSASTALTVIEAAAAPVKPPPKPAAAGCPKDGWKTIRRLRKDGSFTCAALERKAPDFACPKDLEYFEKGLQAGCRKPAKRK